MSPTSFGATLLTWLASLRARLIVTYVLVTLISFGIVLLQLMGPVSHFIVDREENMLRGGGRLPWARRSARRGTIT